MRRKRRGARLMRDDFNNRAVRGLVRLSVLLMLLVAVTALRYC